MIIPEIIEARGGSLFYKGVITVFLPLEDGSVYDRFVGIFQEPGTMAMFLLPALTYALLHSKWLAALVFLFAIYLADSLGGLFGLLVIFIIYAFDRLRARGLNVVIGGLLASVLVMAAYAIAGTYFSEAYAVKQSTGSAIVREDNVKNFMTSLPASIAANPLGFRLTGGSLSDLRSDDNYYGSNFSPYTAFVMGGILGLVGYVTLLTTIIFACLKYFLSGEQADRVAACAFISLPAIVTFVFQRGTIIETVIFGFLFGLHLIKIISIPNSKQFLRMKQKNGGGLRPARFSKAS
jgi:hypothetical protein